MYLNKNKLRRVIRKSIQEGLSGKSQQTLSYENKIKQSLSSFDRSFIQQSYQLCETMPNLNFEQIVREMIVKMLDGLENGRLYDRVMTDVGNLLEVLHSNKRDVFYIENENLENDVQMEFVFKTVTDIMKNLENYYVDYFVAIGKGL